MQLTKLKKRLALMSVTGLFTGAICQASAVLDVVAVHAADKESVTVPDKLKVIVHKLMYDQKNVPASLDTDGDGVIETDNGEGIANSGHEQTLPKGVTAYDKETYGKVGFTLFDVTSSFNGNYSDSQFEKISKDIEKNDVSSTYLKNAPRLAEKFVDASGVANFDDVIAHQANSYKQYALVETTSPKGLVKQKSVPIVFSTPTTNAKGDKYLTDLHLYPKNMTQQLELKLTKIGVEDTAENPLAGAKFQLYKGQPGKGVAVGGVLTADNNGTLIFGSLVKNDHYLVELPSTKVQDPQADDGDSTKFMLGGDAKNNADNKLTFKITEDGVDPVSLKLRYKNYKQPNIDKKLTNGNDTNKDEKYSFDMGETASHKSLVHVPVDLNGDPDGIIYNGTKIKTMPYKTFSVLDRTQKGNIFVPAKGKIVLKTPTGETLTENVDYKVTVVKDSAGKVLGFDIDFLVSNGLASAKVAACGGKDLTLTYNTVITEDGAKVDKIINDIYLKYGYDNDIKTIHDTDVMYSYTAKFVKKDKGLFGTGLAEKLLAGGEFIIENEDGKFYNGTKDIDGDTIKDIVWGDKASAVKLTSQTDGAFELLGLHEGVNYYLHETKAPNGYQLPQEKVQFTVTHANYDTTKKQTVYNNEKPSLPLTGSERMVIGAFGLVVAGTVAGVVYFKKRETV